MRRSKFVFLALIIIPVVALISCALLTGPGSDATARILGRRIGYHGAEVYPGIFLGLAITADEACTQLPEGGTPADVAFSMIVKAIEEKTDDPFLADDLTDVMKIMGVDLDAAFKVINVTPEIQASILQFVCSFAQGVDRAKRSK